MKVSRKEKRLRREFRLLGLKTVDVAKKLNVTDVTVNNWIRGDFFISADKVQMLKEMGVSRKAILKPSEEV